MGPVDHGTGRTTHVGTSVPRALVVGAGVGGLAAALSLHRAGWSVVVCERAEARRTGGYFVRLAPAGVAAAGRLGVDGALRTRLPADGLVVGVDRRGRTVSRVPADLVDDAPGLALVRGDLERALWSALPEAVEVRFGTGPAAVDQDTDGVTVTLTGPDGDPGAVERVDLLVGADGVRSTVRGLVFGPEAAFRQDFDHVVVSAVLPRLPTGLAEGDYVVLAEAGRTAHLMAVRGHRPVVFFTYRADRPEVADGPSRPDAAATLAALRRVYGDFGGLMPEILDGVAEAGTTHADTVAQIHLDRWSRGRVVLLGDAAWCPTLYSGDGSALALAGGDALGRHLAARPGDVPGALAAWEGEQRPGTATARAAARRSRHFFLPGNRAVAVVRTTVLRLLSRPAVDRVVRRALALAAAVSRARPGPHVHPTDTPSSASAAAPSS